MVRRDDRATARHDGREMQEVRPGSAYAGGVLGNNLEYSFVTVE
jgi:hypothetical protein